MTENLNKHQQLNELWLCQEKKFEDLRRELLKAANRVRDAFQKVLGVDEYWIDPITQERHRYVEIINLDNKTKVDKIALSNQPLTDDGIFKVETKGVRSCKVHLLFDARKTKGVRSCKVHLLFDARYTT